MKTTTMQPTLSNYVSKAIDGYFLNLDGNQTTNLYDLVLAQVEEPLFRAVMQHTNNNQSNAAVVLGISRGTLRKKLKQYNL